MLPAAAVAQQTIVVIGDSLSAAHGMAQNEGWVELLAQRVAQQQLPYRVINASISGETTHGARTRFRGILMTHQPTVVIIALGGNDGLRGLSLSAMKKNLDSMIENAKASGARVLLVGMRLPPNYGRTFTEQFAASYQQLAEQRDVALLPFLLQGMERDLTHYQQDGIHPLNTAQPIILDNVWPHLEPLLK